MRAREGRDPDRRPGVNAPNHLPHPSACAEGASERAAAHGGGEIDRSQRDYACAGESRFPIAAHDREGHAGDAGREKAEANHPNQPKLGLAKSARRSTRNSISGLPMGVDCCARDGSANFQNR